VANQCITFALQEIARKQFKNESLVKRLMHHHLSDFPNLFKFSHWHECDEYRQSSDRQCKCNFRIEGVHSSTQGWVYEVPAYEGHRFVPRAERFFRILEKIDTDFILGMDGYPTFRVKSSFLNEVRRALSLSDNCALIEGPYRYVSSPEAIVMPGVRSDVKEILVAAEMRYFSDLEVSVGGVRLKPFSYLDIPKLIKDSTNTGMKSLTQLAYEAASPLYWARQGLAFSSSANLHDSGMNKLYDVVTSYCRPVRGLSPSAAAMSHLFPLAVDMVTHLCGANQEIGKHIGQFDLEEIVRGMYLGSASGVSADQKVEKGTYCDIPTKRNPNGKKFEVLPAAMEQFVNFFTKGEVPITTFKVSYKQEIYFCESPDRVAAKRAKGRIFVIPNLVTILFEHVIGITRMIELRGSIGIGRTWASGGMDALLEMLGVKDTLEDYELNEGDVTKLDQSLCDVLINLFFSSRIRYFDKNDPTYHELKRVIEHLIKEFTQKVTHVVGDVWATVCGGVPSGALHTSHMDSWILLFLFVLFCLDVGEQNPEHKDLITVSLLTKMISIVVYGDDNWYFVRKGPLTALLNANQWAAWLYKHFKIEMRDIRVGHSPVSIPKNGFFESKGGVYLRHYCVANPITGDGQPKYVPYRPMKEVILKVIFGREPKNRDPVNILLSCLGHAYGTYGSNEFTYRWLKALYQSVIQVSGKPLDVLLKSISRAEKDVVRKCRQANITPDQLLAGFPTLEALREKNRYDPSVHSVASASSRAMQYEHY